MPASILLVTLLCSANTVLAQLGVMGNHCSLPQGRNPPPVTLPLPEFPCSAEKAVAEDGPGWLRDRHSLPGSFQLDSSAEGRQGHYCAAGLVLQLKPWMVFFQ